MKIQIFKNNNFGEMRIIEKNEQIYFCLKDVCNILEIGNPSQLKTRLKEDGVISNEAIDKLGRKQDATFINENNLYKVIFQSRKKEAEEFTEWVTSEVLPSIRKNGAYATVPTIEKMIANPDFAINLLNKLKEEQEQRKSLENKILENEPKVLFANCVSSSKTSILVGELAKLLKQNGKEIGQNRLFIWLRENGYLISRKGGDFNMPTQKAMQLGLFEIKENVITHSSGYTTINKTPKVTGKGQIYFINKLKGAKYATC